MALAHEVRALKQRLDFGLVFERHLPENVVLPSTAGVQKGDQVRFRDKGDDQEELRVIGQSGEKVVYVDETGEEHEADIGDLFVVKTFGESVYPTLTPLGAAERGGDRPYHSVINGENYHSLQVLLHCWENRVDLIYIDPPYNTGDPDWKYNNRFVDKNDRYRSSKWLSFMEKRLKLAKRLLNKEGVLVVTIDEHEVHHLGVLLEQLFSDYERQMVTIVNNPKGVTRPQGGLSRVEEYAMVCFPAGSVMEGRGDDLLTPLKTKGEEDLMLAGKPPRWQGLLHSGEDHRRQDRPSMFYPVFIDPDRGAVVGAGGPLLPEDENSAPQTWPVPNLDAKVEGHVAVWPVRKDGTWGRWYIGPDTLRNFATKGYVRLGGYDKQRKTWAMQYLYKSLREQVADGRIEVVAYDETRNVVELRYASEPTRRIKTVWHRSRHDAGAYGSDLLGQFLGGRHFDFPKSVYAVRDTLAAVVGQKKDARIIDFFAGSGTTLHATLLLNAEDDGRRQCLLVTNNEVEAKRARELVKAGHYPGSPEYEAEGIFENVTRPRLEAAVKGTRADDTPVPGTYLDGRSHDTGFEENVEFFRLDYLNPDDIELGRAFAAIHPLLWLIAGGRAGRTAVDPQKPWAVVPDAGYAVLFEALLVRDFIAKLTKTDGVEHLFFVTDSEDAYAEMAEAAGPGYVTHMLYRDYLRNFRIRAVPSS
ncbi:DNA methyltransferase [Baekduia sp.]|uniref:DNA methyltransferase n=1 Tax=Baekduia sp. TaxID=2600305 RepID=UPI002E0C281B|nr:DNA methyltransferase [Baekduia sp.]